ncbi:unnamed protein product, partial [Tenebrio molitor]
ASKLKDFVNIERNPDQDVISFYYEKLRMGKHCNLPDEVITDVIISTINNNIIRASAHAANCKSTEKLLLFLSDYNYVTQTHKHHSSGLNFKSQRFTLGLIQANENVDSVTRSVPVYAVKNHHQEVDLLIGRPFTESSNTYVIKSADTLTFYEEAEFELLSSFHVEEICNKLAIHAEENTTVVPEQQHNSSALIVPSKPIEFHNCL